MKISVIIPVKNEERTIRDVLDSLLTQSRKPDEIVITDGGSTDKTVEIINHYIIKSGLLINLIKVKDALPGRGRNLAIASAKYDIIAMTDAGVILDKQWLENLISPFESNPGIEVVYGIQNYYAKTLFEKCFAIVYIRAGYKLNGKRLHFPYLGATAIKKQTWEKAGRFREDLRATEDILFFKKIKELKFKTAVASEAIAYWRCRSCLKEAFVLAFKYAECDAFSYINVGSHIRRYLIYLVGIIFLYTGMEKHIFILVLIIGFLINSLLVCKKHWEEFKGSIIAKPHAYFIITVIILALNIASMGGFLSGMLKKCLRGLAKKR